MRVEVGNWRGQLMRNLRVLLTCWFVVLGLVLPSWAQGILENPQPASFQSGIGVISGWKCSTAGPLSVQFDTGPLYTAAYGTIREDTQGVCGDTNNGFGLLWNWNRLSDGQHTVSVFDNGVLFASAAVTVTTLGEEFRRGLSGNCALESFPNVGKEAVLQWQESVQNFVIASVSDRQTMEFIGDQIANL